MTLLFMDGFEMGDHLFRYSAIGSLSFLTGTSTRFNYGRCAQSTGSGALVRSLATPVNRCIVGVALYLPSGADTSQIVVLAGDGGATTHIVMRVMANGALSLARGTATQIAITAGNVFTFNVWHYVEVSTTVSDTVGVAKVRLDGVEVLSFTGDTRNAGTNQSIDAITLGAPAATQGRLDDFYICDDTGSAPGNDFLGDVRVVTLSPTGPGNSTGLTPSAAPNWGAVDEQPYSATDFVSSATVGAKDTYATADLPTGVTAVYGVQVGVVGKKSDAGLRSLKTVARSGGVDYSDAAAQVLGTSDGWYRGLRTLDPNGNVAWTPAAVNAMEIGVEVA